MESSSTFTSSTTQEDPDDLRVTDQQLHQLQPEAVKGQGVGDTSVRPHSQEDKVPILGDRNKEASHWRGDGELANGKKQNFPIPRSINGMVVVQEPGMREGNEAGSGPLQPLWRVEGLKT
jgi:hypothetical protein